MDRIERGAHRQNDQKLKEAEGERYSERGAKESTDPEVFPEFEEIPLDPTRRSPSTYSPSGKMSYAHHEDYIHED
jgi:hypothetical protein